MSKMNVSDLGISELRNPLHTYWQTKASIQIMPSKESMNLFMDTYIYIYLQKLSDWIILYLHVEV